tara:strand:- start:189 stop:527 length:339 start_codon:yes stop_codon:yes gene_type:complete
MLFNCTKCAGCCSGENLKNINKKHWGLKVGKNGYCTNLKDDKTCGIYENRPLICRVEELYDRAEEIKLSDPLMYVFIKDSGSFVNYLKNLDYNCNYGIDYLGLDKKYKKLII